MGVAGFAKPVGLNLRRISVSPARRFDVVKLC